MSHRLRTHPAVRAVAVVVVMAGALAGSLALAALLLDAAARLLIAG